MAEVSEPVKALVVAQALNQNQNPTAEELRELVDLVGITLIRKAARSLGTKDTTFVKVGTVEGKYSLTDLVGSVSTANNTTYPIADIMDAKDATAFDATSGKITNNADKAVFSNVTDLIKFLAGITKGTDCHEPLDVSKWGTLPNITTGDDKKRLMNLLYYYYVTAASAPATLKTVIAALATGADLADASWPTVTSSILATHKSAVTLYMAIRSSAKGTDGKFPMSELKDAGVNWQVIATMTDSLFSGVLKTVFQVNNASAIAFVGANSQTGIEISAVSNLTDYVATADLLKMRSNAGPKSLYGVLFTILKNKFSFSATDFKTLVAENPTTYGSSDAFIDMCDLVPTLKTETLSNRMAKFRTTQKGLPASGDLLSANDTQEAVVGVFETDSEFLTPPVQGQGQAQVFTKQFAIPKEIVKTGATVDDSILSDFSRKNAAVLLSLSFSHAKFLTGTNADANATKYASLFTVNTNNEVVAKLDSLAYAFSTLFTDSQSKSKILEKLISDETRRLSISLKESNSGAVTDAIALVKSLLDSGITVSAIASQASGSWSATKPAVEVIVRHLFSEIDNGRAVNTKITALLTHTDSNLAAVRTALVGLSSAEKARLLSELVIRNKGAYANLGNMFSAVDDGQLDVLFTAMDDADAEYTAGFKTLLRSIPFSKVLAKFGAIQPDVGSGLEGELTSRDSAADGWVTNYADATGVKLIADNTSTPAHYLLSYVKTQKVYNSTTQAFETADREVPVFKPADIMSGYGITQTQLADEFGILGVAYN
jgi:hypothetical protein